MREQEINLPKDDGGNYLTLTESLCVPGSVWVYIRGFDGGLGTKVHPTVLLQALHDLGVDVVGFQPKRTLEYKVRQYLDLVSADDIADEIMNIINEHKEDDK